MNDFDDGGWKVLYVLHDVKCDFSYLDGAHVIVSGMYSPSIDTLTLNTPMDIDI